MLPGETDEIDRIRAFNRLYLRELGLIGRSYLGSGLGVTEVRVLYEIAHGARTARAIASALELDEGYLSRVIRAFERRGWLVRSAAAEDRRQRLIGLTEAGRAAAGALEARSRSDIAARLGHLRAPARADLLRGADLIGGALGGAAEPARIAPLGIGDAGWIVMRHGELYARDEGYDASFEALVAGIVAAFLRDHDPAREGGWVAWAGARRVGSVFVMKDDDAVARLRLFLLEPGMRGQGLGRRMLTHATGFARGAGYRTMTLWTHESHRAACALYAAEGFRLVESRPARSFGQDVVEQVWTRAL